eukprot:1159164-Pelagomonas_calceolata.AAC.2
MQPATFCSAGYLHLGPPRPEELRPLPARRAPAVGGTQVLSISRTAALTRLPRMMPLPPPPAPLALAVADCSCSCRPPMASSAAECCCCCCCCVCWEPLPAFLDASPLPVAPAAAGAVLLAEVPLGSSCGAQSGHVLRWGAKPLPAALAVPPMAVGPAEAEAVSAAPANHPVAQRAAAQSARGLGLALAAYPHLPQAAAAAAAAPPCVVVAAAAAAPPPCVVAAAAAAAAAAPFPCVAAAAAAVAAAAAALRPCCSCAAQTAQRWEGTQQRGCSPLAAATGLCWAETHRCLHRTTRQHPTPAALGAALQSSLVGCPGGQRHLLTGAGTKTRRCLHKTTRQHPTPAALGAALQSSLVGRPEVGQRRLPTFAGPAECVSCDCSAAWSKDPGEPAGAAAVLRALERASCGCGCSGVAVLPLVCTGRAWGVRRDEEERRMNEGDTGDVSSCCCCCCCCSGGTCGAGLLRLSAAAAAAATARCCSFSCWRCCCCCCWRACWRCCTVKGRGVVVREDVERVSTEGGEGGAPPRVRELLLLLLLVCLHAGGEGGGSVVAVAAKACCCCCCCSCCCCFSCRVRGEHTEQRGLGECCEGGTATSGGGAFLRASWLT